MTADIANPAEIIRAALESLRASRKVFHSEGDFQHELARKLARAKMGRVRVERPTGFGGRIDIVVGDTAIELKYIRGKFVIESRGEKFVSTIIDDNRRYRHRVCRDIWRLRSLTRSPNSDIRRGFAVILTNKRRFWEMARPPRFDWREWSEFPEHKLRFRYAVVEVK